jgi:hypothetical protein
MRVELFEVEDRLVAVDWSDPKSGRAFAWNPSGWREAPGLVGKSSTDGTALSEPEAKASFPGADFSFVDQLRKGESAKAAA